MSTPNPELIKLLGGRWQVGGSWLIPERTPTGLIIGWPRWTPGGEPVPEHGHARGLVFSPEAIAGAGTSETPIFLVESLDDLVAVHDAEHTAVARPYRSQGYEAVADLVGDRCCIVACSPNALCALASSNLCRHLEVTARLVMFLAVPEPHGSLAGWLAGTPDPQTTLTAALADAVGAPRRRGGAA